MLRQILSSISLLYYPLHDEIEMVKIIKCDKDVIFTYHSSSRKEPLDGVILFKKKEEGKKTLWKTKLVLGVWSNYSQYSKAQPCLAHLL